MSKKLVVALLSLTALVPVHAESLKDRMQKSKPAFSAEVEMSCGKSDKSNCSQVVPTINDHSIPDHLRVLPIESDGSTESAEGVCAGAVATAVGQNDAFNIVIRRPDCNGRMNTLGGPLYPYYGFFVVKASSSASSVSDLVSNTPKGKFLNIAAGRAGSGGQVTLNNILNANSTYKRAISISDFEPNTVLQRLEDGGIDGYFIMDGPGSDKIKQIKNAVDADGKAKYKFLDLRPGDDFYAMTDWKGHKLYQEVVLDGGWFSSTKTVSVDAIVIASEAWRNSQDGAASNILATAIDAAQAGVIGLTETPKDWKPASAQQ